MHPLESPSRNYPIIIPITVEIGRAEQVEGWKCWNMKTLTTRHLDGRVSEWKIAEVVCSLLSET